MRDHLRVTFSFPTAVWLALWLYYDKNGSAVCSICAAALHECGHIAALRLFHDPPREIRIGLFGAAIARQGAGRLSYTREMLAAAAGPGVNLLLAAVLAALATAWPRLFAAARVNLALALFNLLPLRGLDGGQILYAALCRTRLPEDAQKQCKTIAVCAAVPLTAIGFWLCRVGWSSYSLLLSSLSVLSVVLP